jgi:hypothetical protein
MTVLITFFYSKGIIYFEFIPRGQTVKQAYYAEILKQLYEAVGREGPKLWSSNWILCHNSATAHKVLSLKQFQSQKSITEIEYSPSYPHLALNDFWLFPKIKSALKDEDIRILKIPRKNVTMALKAIPQQVFQKCFQQWQQHWAKFIAT